MKISSDIYRHIHMSLFALVIIKRINPDTKYINLVTGNDSAK
jgi:hypothetical protein